MEQPEEDKPVLPSLELEGVDNIYTIQLQLTISTSCNSATCKNNITLPI